MDQKNPSDGWEDMPSDGWVDMAPQQKAEPPRRKLAGALARLLPMPNTTQEENAADAERAIGMGMGMTMPNPIRVFKDLIPKASAEAADPVLQQIQRVNAKSGGQAANPLPEIPKALKWLLPSKASKVYDILRGATERKAAPPENPYPASEGPITTYRPAPAGPPAPNPLSPELGAAAQASRDRVLSRIQPAEEVAATPEASGGTTWRMAGPPPPRVPAPPSPELQAAAQASRDRVLARIQSAEATPAQQFKAAIKNLGSGDIYTGQVHADAYEKMPQAVREMMDSSSASFQHGFVDQAGRFHTRGDVGTAMGWPGQQLHAKELTYIGQGPGPGIGGATSAPVSAVPTPTAEQIFEAAARGRKVSELVKAIDANASAHLGVNPQDPRFAEALQSLPPEWWHGMAQVAKINKPSAETISQAVEFFSDRAAQGVKAVQ